MVFPIAVLVPNFLPAHPIVFDGARNGIMVRALLCKPEVAPTLAVSNPAFIPPFVTPLAKPIPILGIKAAEPAVAQFTGSNITSKAKPRGKETILGAPTFPSKLPKASLSLIFALMFSSNPFFVPFPSAHSAPPAIAYKGAPSAPRLLEINPSFSGGTSSPSFSGPYHCSLNLWLFSCSIALLAFSSFASKLKSAPVGVVFCA